MKLLLIALFTNWAHAALLNPVIDLSCKTKDGTVFLTVNDGTSHGLIFKGKSREINCAFKLKKTSHYMRGPQNVKTFHIELQSCEKNVVKDSAPEPFLMSGFFVISKLPKSNFVQLHILKNSQPITCDVLKVSEKKLEKIKID